MSGFSAVSAVKWIRLVRATPVASFASLPAKLGEIPMDHHGIEQLAVQLPVGTVTFLLTDVENSTFLWESAPEAMGAAIRRHYQLLDAAVLLHNGVRPQEQGEGDSTVAAFGYAGDALAAALDTERRNRLEGDERGRQLLGGLDVANFSAAATAVTGPGLTVTITDPGASKDLSDVSKQRVEGSRQVILDRDLQLVVNSLWASDAEAVSVGGVRIGPNVTIRQAGGGILVDNQPIASPYEILAIGPPHAMADAFDRSPGLQRLRLLEASYGVTVTVSATDTVTVPAGSVRDVNFGRKFGDR